MGRQIIQVVVFSEQPMTGNRTEEFVRVLAKYQRRIFSFVLTLVPQWADAEEIFQETSIILWRKFDTFEPGSDFLRWANRVAYFEVLKYRKRQSKKMQYFGEELLELLANDVTELSDSLQIEHQNLVDCFHKLPEKDRRLIRLRYHEDASPKLVAEKVGRPVDSVYKSLSRVRRNLLACVQRLNATMERR